MSRRLKFSVMIGSTVYEAGTEPPEDVAGQITNPDAWDGESSGEPPRSGKGSSADVWRKYAESLGVTVDEDATRDDIIAQLDSR